MQMFGNSLHCESFDLQNVVTRVLSPADVGALPRGALVGDSHGGVTFTDAVARELEKRSTTGWLSLKAAEAQKPWTVIVLNR